MKKKKEMRFHPVLVFLVLILIVAIVSGIGYFLKIETSYSTVNAVTGELENQLVMIDSIFNRTGIQYVLSNMIKNFVDFAPLGALITGLLGIGVAYKSGLLTTIFTLIKETTSRRLITFIVVFLGILCSMFYEVGYVILVPISAILFMTLDRHPSLGVCAAFAGITFGYGAGFVVNGLDGGLFGYTENAIHILDATYKLNLYGNLFFIIVSSLLLAYLGMVITERYIVPKLGKFVKPEMPDETPFVVTSKEKKGLILALSATSIIALIIIYCIIPGLPFSGLLLYLKDARYVDQLFGANSYFNQGSVFIISALFTIAGSIYGFRTKMFKNNKDFIDGMNYYLTDISSILVLIFFAAQFCAIYKKTNIGVFITAALAELLGNLQLTGLLLVIVTFIVILICTFFLPSAFTKWAILSPVMIPLYMQSSMTPEFATAVFRAGTSAMQGITPLFTYFIILLGFLQIYNQKKREAVTITDAMSMMLPYTIAYVVLWFVIILGFYIIGIPLGPGTGISL